MFSCDVGVKGRGAFYPPARDRRGGDERLQHCNDRDRQLCGASRGEGFQSNARGSRSEVLMRLIRSHLPIAGSSSADLLARQKHAGRAATGRRRELGLTREQNEERATALTMRVAGWGGARVGMAIRRPRGPAGWIRRTGPLTPRCRPTSGNGVALLQRKRGACGCARPFVPLRPPLRRTSRWLMSSCVCSPPRQRRTRRLSHHNYYQHYAAQQQLEQQRQQEWLSAFVRKRGFQRLDRAAAFMRRRGFNAQRRWRFLKMAVNSPRPPPLPPLPEFP